MAAMGDGRDIEFAFDYDAEEQDFQEAVERARLRKLHILNQNQKRNGNKSTKRKGKKVKKQIFLVENLQRKSRVVVVPTKAMPKQLKPQPKRVALPIQTVPTPVPIPIPVRRARAKVVTPGDMWKKKLLSMNQVHVCHIGGKGRLVPPPSKTPTARPSKSAKVIMLDAATPKSKARPSTKSLPKERLGLHVDLTGIWDPRSPSKRAVKADS